MMQEDEVKELFRTYQGGRFEITRLLKAGGMGTVMVAFDTRLKVHRAIKLIHSELLADKEMIRRFENEAAMMASIDHPNIVKVFDIGEVGGNHFLVLEWVDGGSLEDHIDVFAGDPPKGMPPRQALEMIYRVCEALQVAHDLGIIHRDIKPDNVLVTKKGIPKVADFGIARMGEKTSQLTIANQAMGTPGYIPLEQLANAKNVDARADIHALGVMFWTLLTACHPPSEGMFSANLEDHPDMLDSIPECLHEIIRRMVALFAHDRYGSVRELVAVLKSIEDQLPENPSDMPNIGLALDVKAFLREHANEAPEPTLIPQALEATRVARAAAPISSPEVFADTVYAPRRISSPPNTEAYAKPVTPLPSTNFGRGEIITVPAVAVLPPIESVLDSIAEPISIMPVKISKNRSARSHWIIGFTLSATVIGVFVWSMNHRSVSEKTIVKSDAHTSVQMIAIVNADANVADHPDSFARNEPDTISNADSIGISSPADSSDVASDVESDEVSTMDVALEKEIDARPPPHPLLARAAAGLVKDGGSKSKKLVGDGRDRPAHVEPKAVIVKAGETKTFPQKTIEPPKVDVVEKVFISLDVPGDDSARVYLVSAHGKFKLPGSVPPGTYRVVSTFKDRDGEVITVEVKEGQSFKIFCNVAFAKCMKR